MSQNNASRFGAVGAWVKAVLAGGSLLLAPLPKGAAQAAQAAEAPQVPRSDEADADPIATDLACTATS